jgi:pimeloyl-ACP methyl ester carboxylesterase
MGEAMDQVHGVINDVCGGSAIVVGQSLGGYIAMLVAARHPEAIAGLVLSNCSAEPRTVARHATGAIWSYLRMSVRQQVKGHVPGPEEWPEAQAASASSPASGSMPASGAPSATTAAESASTDSVAADSVAADSVAAAEPFEPATRGLLFKGSRHALSAAVRTRFRDHLASYPGSTLILNGENDTPFRRSEREFLAVCRDGRLVVVPGAGHLVNIEGADAYNIALSEFVDAVRAGRRVAG